jgi:hypothetical protein
MAVGQPNVLAAAMQDSTLEICAFLAFARARQACRFWRPGHTRCRPVRPSERQQHIEATAVAESGKVSPEMSSAVLRGLTSATKATAASKSLTLMES